MKNKCLYSNKMPPKERKMSMWQCALIEGTQQLNENEITIMNDDYHNHSNAVYYNKSVLVE